MSQTTIFFFVLAVSAYSQTLTPQEAPANLRPPDGHVAFLKLSATGTQNYVCLPGASGLAWKFQGPQATLFAKFRLLSLEVQQQLATHFLSLNPKEPGTARATWQSSSDSSAVWAKKIDESTDPRYVSPNAIPWFLLQIVGSQKGPNDGAFFTQITYMQRVNTDGGIMPAEACTEAGSLRFVPYKADYVFFRASR
jgi:hypothetical protein